MSVAVWARAISFALAAPLSRTVLRCSRGHCCAAAVMTTVPNLISELSHMIQWVHTQIGCGLDPASCAQQQFDCLTGKIRSLSAISVEEATDLVSAIRTNALGEWTEGQIAELCGTVGNKCHGIATTGDKRWQEVVAFPKFMTASEIDSLKSGNLSEKAMIKVVVHRAHKLGMYTLSETAKGHIAAVVATANKVDTAGKPWLDLLKKVKTGLGVMKSTSWQHRTIWMYDNPSDIMDEPWYAAAYSDGGPSGDTWEIDEPECVRGSHRSSGKNKARDQAASSTAGSPAAMTPSELGAYQNMFGHGLVQALFTQVAAAAAQPPKAAAPAVPPHATSSQWLPPPATLSQWSPAPGLTPSPKAAAPAAVAEVATDPATAAAEKAHVPEEAVVPPGAPPALSDEEDLLRKSIANRAALRRPAAAAPDAGEEGAGEEDGVRKRPAAGGGPAMKATKIAAKKPAAAKPAAAKPSKLPAPPNDGAPPLHYRVGSITTGPCRYRAIVGRADTRVRWDTGYYTRKEAFAKAMAFIDERS